MSNKTQIAILGNYVDIEKVWSLAHHPSEICELR